MCFSFTDINIPVHPSILRNILIRHTLYTNCHVCFLIKFRPRPVKLHDALKSLSEAF